MSKLMDDLIEDVKIATVALREIATIHMFASEEEAEKWARDIAVNALEEMLVFRGDYDE